MMAPVGPRCRNRQHCQSANGCSSHCGGACGGGGSPGGACMPLAFACAALEELLDGGAVFVGRAFGMMVLPPVAWMLTASAALEDPLGGGAFSGGRTSPALLMMVLPSVAWMPMSTASAALEDPLGGGACSGGRTSPAMLTCSTTFGGLRGSQPINLECMLSVYTPMILVIALNLNLSSTPTHASVALMCAKANAASSTLSWSVSG